MDKQYEDKDEENDIEDFGKWNDNKGEVDETRQKEMRDEEEDDYTYIQLTSHFSSVSRHASYFFFV